MARLISATIALLAFASGTQAIWPMPAQLQSGSTGLKLSSSFSIKLAGALASPHIAPADLIQAISRTSSQLKNDKMERLVVGGAAADASKLRSAKSLPSIELYIASSTAAGNATTDSTSVPSIGKIITLPFGKRDEHYTLTVPVDGNPARLTASTSLGLLRGLTTFTQMWYTSGSTIYTVEAPFTINDKPAYPYRGFMLDTARNYYAVSDILRTLDAMSLVKASTFHWHIVDSQSFPLVVNKFPELSAKGAYSQSQIYTPADVANVHAYAAARGIDVMVEIDTPGHTAIIAESHPELIACPGATPWTSFANEPPAGQLRLASPDVLKFTTDLFSAVLPGFIGTYFSTGGDEINANCYNKDAETQAELTKSGQTFEQALSHFVQNGHKTVESFGKIPVVWEEMVLDHNVTLSNNTVVMVWISAENARAVADKGYSIIHAPSDYFYLDCGAGAWVGNFVNGNSWCDPFHTWQKAYSFNPLANISDAQIPQILGGQQLLWSEQSNPNNLDSIVWPRAAATSEVFWTGPKYSSTVAGNVTTTASTKEALPRLHDLRYRMVQRGIQAVALQPHWCAVRPNACDLS